MRNVYFISGLGADKRAFSLLNLLGIQPIFIDWIKPIPKETLQAYALRLKSLISEQSPIIVGLSFGGMLVTEMAKADASVKAIIISSNKTHKEFPFWLRIGKYFPVYKWVPDKYFASTNIALFWFMGAKSNKVIALAKEIVKDTDIPFTKWAIEAIMHWNNTIIPSNLVHIHGTADKLLPYYLAKPDFTIQNGEHLMVMDRADELVKLLFEKKLLQ